jgi:hypothetical protein
MKDGGSGVANAPYRGTRKWCSVLNMLAERAQAQSIKAGALGSVSISKSITSPPFHQITPVKEGT